MKASVYIIAGILDSGKTTWINHMLASMGGRRDRPLIVQLEQGEEAVHMVDDNCRRLMIPIQEFTSHTEEWRRRLYECIVRDHITTVYMEWNGIAPFTWIEDLFLQGQMKKLCKMKQVVYLVKGGEALKIIKGMGAGPRSQMERSDIILYRGEMDEKERKLVKRINPTARLYKEKEARQNCKEIMGEKSSPYMGLAMIATLLFVLGLLYPIFQTADHRISDVVVIFVGLMLQGIPFLLIGVLLSSFIQVFISREAILKWFPKGKWRGMFVAVLAGFCLPVCDCASIPIFKSLVRKGIPLYVAVTFMFAAPVINPVVMLSTFYAFDGQVGVVAVRVLLGIIAAVGIGVLISKVSGSEDTLRNTWEGAGCSCGCDGIIMQGSGLKGKFLVFLRHSQLEFLDVGRYLLLGTFLSAIFQVVQSEHELCVCEWPFVMRLLLMMVLSFLLSLCSSADAVVAKGFVGEFSLAAVMGFLVFGPMLDIKNVLMLQSGFSKKFIGKLCGIAFLTCFVVVLIASAFWKGGM